ncbi:unnamed protein product [Mucor hiemalis]
MKFYDTNRKYNRMSLLSKHLSPSKSKTHHFSKRNLSCQRKSIDQKKSGYYRCINKPSIKDHEEKEEAHLTQLRREAYEDLHSQLQLYNDEFIASMRSIENNPSLSSTESLCSANSEDSTMQNLIELFEAGSVKDYSQLIEWELYKNPPTYFECQGEYGDLW